MKMEKINSARDLQIAIRTLEEERGEREKNLKLQFDEIADSLRPINILKRSVQGIFQKPNDRHDLLAAILAVGTGLISKKMFEGKSPGPVRKTAGQALQLGVTTLVAKNAPALKTAGASLFNKIFRKIKKPG